MQSSIGLTDYSPVDTLGVRYTSVNFERNLTERVRLQGTRRPRRPRSGWPTILKLTHWVFGTNPSTSDEMCEFAGDEEASTIFSGSTDYSKVDTLSVRYKSVKF